MNYLLFYRATNSSIVYTLSKRHLHPWNPCLIDFSHRSSRCSQYAGLLPSRDNIRQGHFVGLRGCGLSKNPSLLTVEVSAREFVCWVIVWSRFSTTEVVGLDQNDIR